MVQKMTETEYIINEEFTIDDESTLLVEVKEEKSGVVVTILDNSDKENYEERLIVGDSTICKIDPYIFSAMVFTSNALQMKPNASFFVRKVKETISNKEYISIVLSRVDLTHCG